jgi:hypothetical protein
MGRNFFPARVWSDVEDAYVIQNAHRQENEVTAQRLGRSVTAVKSRQRLLGVPSRKFKGVCENALCSAPIAGPDGYCDCCDYKPDDKPSRKEVVTSELTARELGLLWGVSVSTAQSWINWAGGKLSDKTSILKSLYYPDISDEKFQELDLGSKEKNISRRSDNHSRGGHRADIGIFVRSSWEANTIRYMNLKGITWQYEPQVFRYPVAKGTVSYTPDFWLPQINKWIEVKGRLSSADKVKMNRLKQFEPKEFKKMTVIVKNPKSEAAKFYRSLGIPVFVYYDDLAKSYSKVIKEWEK